VATVHAVATAVAEQSVFLVSRRVPPCSRRATAAVNLLLLLVSRREARCRRGLRWGAEEQQRETLRRRCAQMRGALRARLAQMRADDFESLSNTEPEL
jgi:hypothetical protein